MKPTLSIITINYNNASGLRKTMESVLNQTSNDFEYIVVDGGAKAALNPQPPLIPPKEGDKEILEHFIKELHEVKDGFHSCTWLSPFGGVGGGFYSEPDSGIYNAMNKGIRMAKGEYVQFINSGDLLVSSDVTERMLKYMENQEPRTKNQEIMAFPPLLGNSVGAYILYGNMLKQLPKRIIRDRGFAGRQPSMLDFYTGTLNHSPAYIKRDLFDTYGLYDESLKIVSDWKWYLQVIALNGIKPKYVDIDVTVFDMTGISTVNSNLDRAERKHVFSEILPASVLSDYERWAFPIDQMKRINRYGLTRIGFILMERILFKLEKWFQNKKTII